MGFNYTTIGSTQAHVHSNGAGQGGSLSSATLLNNTSLQALILMGADTST